MSIKRKIQIILLGGWLLIALTGLLGLVGMKGSNREIQSIYRKNLTIIQKLGRVMELMRNNRIQLLLALQHDPANPGVVSQHDHALAVHTDLVEKNIREIDGIMNEIDAAGLDRDERKLAADFETKRKLLVKDGLLPVREAILAGRFAQATSLTLTSLNPLFKPASEAAQAIYDFQSRDAVALYDEATQHYHHTIALIIGLAAAAIIGSGLVGLVVIRSVSGGAKALIEASDAMARGDLTRRINPTGRDEFSSIGGSFDNMAQALSSIVSRSLSVLMSRPRNVSQSELLSSFVATIDHPGNM